MDEINIVVWNSISSYNTFIDIAESMLEIIERKQKCRIINFKDIDVSNNNTLYILLGANAISHVHTTVLPTNLIIVNLCPL